MNHPVDVVAVRPAHVTAYRTLFEAALGHHPSWSGCYCAYYDVPGNDDAWDPSASGADEHRRLRCSRIEHGRASGLLAFVQDVAVGWCNAGPQAAYVNLRGFATPATGVGSVLCFVIHPDHRRRGVAGALLAGVDGYFRRLGLTAAEGYPRRDDLPVAPDDAADAFHRGTPSMFLHAGYQVVAEHAHHLVMRRRLGP